MILVVLNTFLPGLDSLLQRNLQLSNLTTEMNVSITSSIILSEDFGANLSDTLSQCHGGILQNLNSGSI